MIKRRDTWLLVLLTVLSVGACAAEPEEADPVDQASANGEATSGPVIVEPLPDMPPFPAPRRGFMVVTSAGPHHVEGAWRARAGICEDPPMLTVVAEESGIGVLVLLQLPPAGLRITSYPITLVEGAVGFPEPPAAQLAVQLLTGRNVYGFQGDTGRVEVYGFGELLDRIDPRERAVSGRFAVTVREIQSEQRVQVAGVFDGIGVAPLPAEQCRAARDAAATADSAGSPPPRSRPPS